MGMPMSSGGRPGPTGMTLRELGRGVIDDNLYLVLATADPTGLPWSSPVYFAHRGYAEFFWLSAPDAAHSRNIAARPEVGIVVFDSGAAIGTGQGVYLSARAEQVVDDDDIDRGIGIFSRRSLGHGRYSWTRDDVRGTSGLRLYRATADQHWMLAKDGGPDRRTPSPLA